MTSPRQRVAFSAVLSLALSASAATIRDVRVEAVGDVPFAADQVIERVSARPGTELDRELLSSDIRSIHEAGNFSYAEARVVEDGDEADLVYRVSARPKIRTISVDGAKAVSNRKVRDLLAVAPGDWVDDAVLGAAATAVKEKYRKEYYPSAKLEWDLVPVEGRPGFVDVAIRVVEGRRAVVRRILTPGAKHVKRKALLANVEQTRYHWLWSWATGSGTYVPSLALAGSDAMRKVLMDEGYLAGKVSDPSYRYVSEKKLDLTYEVTEGPLFRVGSWELAGNKTFTRDELQRCVVAKPGAVARYDEIEASAKNLRDYYGARGYIRTRVIPRLLLDPEAARATVTYEIREGVFSTIRDVAIRGNSKTKDKVIRREISVAPGEVYNEVRVRSSENRLRNLNYFSYVGSYPEETARENEYDVVFDVEEKSTGQFQIGVAFSSVDNILGYAELSQGNFDLLGALTGRSFTGAGQKLRLRGQIGDSRNDVELSFIEPWFLDRQLSLGLDLYRHETSYSDEYDQTRMGGSASLSHPLGAFNRATILYGLENIKIDDIGEDATRWIREEEGSRLKSFSTLTLVRDTRDRIFIPTKGFRGSISGTLAGGPLGAETDYYGGEVRAAQHFPLFLGSVLSFRGFATAVQEFGDSDRVPIFDRIFMGGPRTVRAFKYRKVGPKDETREPIGGRSGAFGSVEWTIPVVESFLRFAVFYDCGAVWMDVFKKGDEPLLEGEGEIVGDGVFCAGYGIGLRLDIPNLPIQLDYAWPTDADEMNDSSGRFSFSLGYTY
ncbi:MAG: outer membrane protein assembly factor BamA [Kiritimatiellae bacterium]|nr:outer membrane protein assembly factor BamA [Kiritimatiellia bacterium]